jgi:tetratricopeptide (TPR) repeat protein
MRRSLSTALAAAAFFVTAANAQLTLPPSGENQKSSVTQHIGPVRVTIDYSSPDVHAPNGEDRRGKIWGQLVPYGMTDLGFGPCKSCPWRAGANENTVFTVSHDVKVEGQPLPAGRYGLHMIADPNEWTVIFSKNSEAWGSYSYDPAEDALRVKVKPSKSEYNEWLTYEFTDRRPDKATVALKWEELQVPFTVSVDNVAGLYIAQLRDELRSQPGFDSDNWVNAAQYALRANRPNDALFFAENAVSFRGIGQENFRTLSTLSRAQEAAGKTAEAKATLDKAVAHPSASPIDIHQLGRQLQQAGKKEQALAIYELNAKKNPNVWPVHVGLARGYSAMGRYKEALKHARLALAQAPDEQNKRFLTDGIAKLEAGKDMNQ